MKITQLTSRLEEPTKALVEKFVTEYKKDSHYSHADELQRKLAAQFAGDYESILSAAIFLNQIYSTNIYSVYGIADHIYSKRDAIIPAIKAGKTDAVTMIAQGHGIVREGKEKEIVFYSFATKFCNYLNPTAYSIFDSHVEKMLKAYNRKFGFYTGQQKNLRDYATFKEWIQAFLKHFDLNCTLWKLDKFLWTYYISLSKKNK